MRLKTAVIILTACVSGTIAHGAFSQGSPAEDAHEVHALVLLGEWFGDTYFPLKEALESRRWEMVRAGVDSSYRGCYNKARDVELTSDVLIPDLRDFSGYDCLIIPSGPQFRKFRQHPEVYEFVRLAHEAGLFVASFCVGNNVVSEAGLTDLPYTDLFPAEVTWVSETVLIGPRGGGPPPGDGYRSAPVENVLDALAEKMLTEDH